MPVYLKAGKNKHHEEEDLASDNSEAIVEEINQLGEDQNDEDEQSTDQEVELKFNEPAQWVERMALTATKPLPKDLKPDDDPKREEVFLQQALLSANRGISLLEAANIPWQRPDDFYAEMYKSDVHMDKIRQAMMSSKTAIEARVQRRAIKEQKQFGKEVQAEVLRQRAKNKREMIDKVSRWRKRGRGDDIDDVLDDEAQAPKKRGRPEPRSKNVRPGGKKGHARPGKNARQRRH